MLQYILAVLVNLFCSCRLVNSLSSLCCCSAESRKIALAGGYSFNVTQVPNAFVFTSP